MRTQRSIYEKPSCQHHSPMSVLMANLANSMQSFTGPIPAYFAAARATCITFPWTVSIVWNWGMEARTPSSRSELVWLGSITHYWGGSDSDM